MKRITQLFIVFFVITISQCSYSQTYGIKTGINFSKLLYKDNNKDHGEFITPKLGFQLGATIEFPIYSSFAIEAGACMLTKGRNLYEEQLDGKITYSQNISLFYLDIPINAKAYYKVGSFKFYCVLGSYLGIGLSGKGKGKETYYGTTTSDLTTTMKWGSDAHDNFRRFDYGLNFGGGLGFKNIQIGIIYNLGLRNLSSSATNGLNQKNRMIEISLNYKFKNE